MKVTLRDYQSNAISEARKLIARGIKRFVIVAATGAGKTTIAAAIIEGAGAKGSKICFLAHRKELIDQASKRLDDMGLDHGVCKASHHRSDPRKWIQVASVQSLVNRTSLYSFDIIFIDECHRANAGTYKKILAEYPKAIVIGLTATPYRSDGQGLRDIFDEMIIVRSMKNLIKEGHLIAPRYFSKSMDISSLKSKGSDFDGVEMGKSLSKPALVGDIVAEWKKIAMGRTTVGFASSVEHSKVCVAAFEAAGITAEHLDATLPDDEREAVLSRLASGQTRIVFNVGILSEGWDLPQTSCCIVATLTLSRMKWMQMAGRVLRPSPESGKKDAIIIDHYGNCFIHGPVESDITLTLDGTEKKTKAQAEKAIATAKVCKKCFAPNPADISVCGVCGSPLSTPKKIVKVSGELVEVSNELPPEIEIKTVPASTQHLSLFVDGKFERYVDASKYKAGSWRVLKYCGGTHYSHSGGVRCKWYGPITYLISLGSLAAASGAIKSEYDKLKVTAKEKGYKQGWASALIRAKYGSNVKIS
jgi:DNA repair protein RadD